jgi:hypothetical protein
MSAPFSALSGLIEEGRVMVHVTDITLSGLESQIRDQAARDRARCA